MTPIAASSSSSSTSYYVTTDAHPSHSLSASSDIKTSSVGEKILTILIERRFLSSLKTYSVYCKKPLTVVEDWDIKPENSELPANEYLFYRPELFINLPYKRFRERGLIWLKLKKLASMVEEYHAHITLSHVSRCMHSILIPDKGEEQENEFFALRLFIKNKIIKEISAIQSQVSSYPKYSIVDTSFGPSNFLEELISGGFYTSVVKFFLYHCPSEAIWNSQTNLPDPKRRTLLHIAVSPPRTFAFSSSLVLMLLARIKEADLSRVFLFSSCGQIALSELEQFESNLNRDAKLIDKHLIDCEGSLEQALKILPETLYTNFIVEKRKEISKIKKLLKNFMIEAGKTLIAKHELTQKRAKESSLIACTPSHHGELITPDFPACIAKTFGDAKLILGKNGAEIRDFKILAEAHEALEQMHHELSQAPTDGNLEEIKKRRIEEITKLIHQIQFREVEKGSLHGAQFICKLASSGLYHEVLKIYFKAIPGTIQNQGFHVFNALMNPSIDQYPISFLIEILEIIKTNGLKKVLLSETEIIQLKNYLATRIKNESAFKSKIKQEENNKRLSKRPENRAIFQLRINFWQHLLDNISEARRLEEMLFKNED